MRRFSNRNFFEKKKSSTKYGNEIFKAVDEPVKWWHEEKVHKRVCYNIYLIYYMYLFDKILAGIDRSTRSGKSQKKKKKTRPTNNKKRV